MCKFCTQHGEGKKWYLAMKNYSIELMDQKDRRRYAAEFLNGFHRRVPRSIQNLNKIHKTPLMAIARRILTRVQKQDHFGQVVPMEDVEKYSSRYRAPSGCRVSAGA